MPVYLVFIREEPFQDESEMEEYRRKLRTNPPDSSKLTPLVLNGATESLEGEAPPQGLVIFGFPTSDDAKAWYNSSAYQDALPHRLKAAKFRVLVIEGISAEAFAAEAKAPS